MNDPPADPVIHQGRWLCIAYAFPPINRSGTHRTLAFVRHLDRLGWDASVLTVQPRGEPIDETLLAKIPLGTRVVRSRWVHLLEAADRLRSLFRRKTTGRNSPPPLAAASRPRDSAGDRCGIKEIVSSLLTTPDSRVGWVPFALRAGLREIKRARPKVIYSTSPYASAHLIALLLSAWRRIPWVADFRDPWSANPFRSSTPGLTDALEGWLERLVLRRAAHVVYNTPTAAAEMQRRYPWIAPKCTTILNGIDPELFDAAQPIRTEPRDRFVLLHCGQFYGQRSPHVWFDALRTLQKEAPEVAARIRFISLGATHYDGSPLERMASEYGVGRIFSAVPSSSHQDAIALMLSADALGLATSAGAGAHLQVPNKLFEYLGARRPILATAAPDSPVRDILRQAHADCVVCPQDDPAELARGLRYLATRPAPADPALWSGVERFHRDQQAAQLRAVFVQVSGNVRHCPPLPLVAPAPAPG